MGKASRIVGGDGDGIPEVYGARRRVALFRMRVDGCALVALEIALLNWTGVF